MAGDHDDLLPLFLAEARERLQRLDDAVGQLPDEPQAVARARRELHALKGSSRMMGLGELAALCHRGEEALADGTSVELVDVLEVVRTLQAGIEALGDLQRTAGGPASSVVPDTGPQGVERGGVWITTGMLDGLSDRATRSRMLSVAAGGMIDRLFELAGLAERGVGEPIPAQVLATLAASLRHLGLELETGQRRLARLSEAQLDALVALQVQPLEPYLRGLAAHAAELAGSMNKRVDVEVAVGGVRLDRRILATLRESFLHLVRNAVDHGIETVDERRRSGKPEVGTVIVTAETEGDRVRLAVVDDGRGIDPADIRRRARELGVHEHDLDDAEVLHLLLRPGFTTRAEATEISGRGIGLDAVSEAVRGVGGDLTLTSAPAEGTAIRLELPVVKRSEWVTVVRAGRHVVALPSRSVKSFRRVTFDDIDGPSARATVRIGPDGDIPAWILRRAFGDRGEDGGVLVEVHARGRSHAIVVDAVESDEEVVIRPVPGVCGVTGLFDGLALTAAGLPVALLSVDAIDSEGGALQVAVTDDGGAGDRRARVLLVDDSSVTRAMIRRILEDAGFDVVPSAGGEEAWARLRTERFDCLVTDIEMPDVDGLELTRRVRAHPEIEELLIVVVSTRSRAKDRLHGLDAGADAYLTKQNLDARELVELVRRAGAGR